MIPTIGRIVHYTLSETDADQINRRVADANANLSKHREEADGKIIHVANTARVGDVLPAIIVRVWGNTPESSCNLQVFVDGNHTLWATSRSQGEGPGTWIWPPRV